MKKFSKEKVSSIDKNKSEVEKVIVEDISKDNDEPSWYHYVIVTLFLFVILFGVYFIFDYYDSSNSNNLNNSNVSNMQQIYNYKFVENNITFTLQFNSMISEIENSNLTVEISKYEILNSENLLFSFMEYNGTDNKYVSISSVKLMKLFKYLFNYDFETTDFVEFSKINCSNSTILEKVVVFNPYSNREGVFYNSSNGCVEIESMTPSGLVFVNDVFMYRVVNQ